MRLSVHTVRLFFTILAGTCAFWGFPDSGPDLYTLLKMVANSKNALLKACAIILATTMKKRRAKLAAKRRIIWVREWIKTRIKLGASNALQKELEDQDAELFRIFLQMDKNTVTTLLDMVSPYISKKDTVMREAISPEGRLALTLRYLASGMHCDNNNYNYIILLSARKQYESIPRN